LYFSTHGSARPELYVWLQTILVAVALCLFDFGCFVIEGA
jgi:hypothetical protein